MLTIVTLQMTEYEVFLRSRLYDSRDWEDTPENRREIDGLKRRIAWQPFRVPFTAFVGAVIGVAVTFIVVRLVNLWLWTLG